MERSHAGFGSQVREDPIRKRQLDFIDEFLHYRRLLIVSQTVENKNMIKNQIIKAKIKWWNSYLHVCTLDSALLNIGAHGFRYSVLLVDEAFLNHPGAIMLLAIAVQAKIIFLFGDRQQICVVNRVRNFEMKFEDWDEFDRNLGVHSVKEPFMNVSHRVRPDVARAFSYLYRAVGGFSSARSEQESMFVVLFDKDQFQLPYLEYELCTLKQDADKDTRFRILTFTQYSKDWLKSYFPFLAHYVNTVHERQGATYDVVCLC